MPSTYERASFIEHLEGRRLKSSTVLNRVLIIEGTSTDDHISMSLHAEDGSIDVNENGDRSNVRSEDIDRIDVHGGNGNDIIDVDPVNGAVSKPVSLFGEQGDDSLTGGAASDELHGGRGKDSLNGGDGNDTLAGGRGHDLEHGEKGDDSLSGGGADDSLFGDAGDDNIHGGNGNDDAHGAGGNDNIDGDIGDDSLMGGLGDDHEEGGEGLDDIHGGRGRNSFGSDDVIGSEIKDHTSDDSGGRAEGSEGHDG